MKSKIFSGIITILLILILGNNFVSFAIDKEFATEELSTDAKSSFLNNIDLAVINEEPEKRAIECFDISNNKDVAIGFSDYDNKTICVYSDSGEFQYGYRFKCSGMFAVEWNDGNIVICFVRSDVMLKVTADGSIVEIAEIKDTIENNEHWNDILYSTKRTSGNTEYIIKNEMSFLDIFSSSYSNLIAIDEEGNESIIYVADSSRFAVIIAIILMIVIFAFLLVSIIREKKKQEQKTFKDTVC